MKYTINFILFLLLSANSLHAQDNALDAKLMVCQGLIDQGKTYEADSFLSLVVKSAPHSADAWDMLGVLRLQAYEDSKSKPNPFANIVIETKDKSGKPIKDSLSDALMKSLKEMDPAARNYSKMIYTLRKGSLLAPDAYKCGITLRLFSKKDNVDTVISDKAYEYYAAAEKEFFDKNYSKAAVLYQKAIDVQPGFFKASLYLGDCYYMLKDYQNAIVAFKEATEKFPNLVEPRKFLMDAYAQSGYYAKALDEGYYIMTMYPDYIVSQKIRVFASKINQEFDEQPLSRPVFPNNNHPVVKPGINDYEESDTLELVKPWTFYRNAGYQIAPYCNAKGVVTKANDLTTSRYMEVYSWEEMLKNSKDAALDEARKMQKLNYLDCYALVTCFHYDIYDQYLDFVSRNREKVLQYYRYIVQRK